MFRHPSSRRILWNVAAIFVAVTFLHSCSGGSCSRNDATYVAPAPENEARSTEDIDRILNQPAPFDAQAIDECARMLATEKSPDKIVIAQSIVAAQAGLNRLCQILEDLERNEDNADTWNTLTELSHKSWAAQTVEISTIIDELPLDENEYVRAEGLRLSIERCRDLVKRLRDHVQSAPSPFGDR